MSLSFSLPSMSETLKGVTFKWKDRNISGENQIGLIAQDVEKVFPEAVTENDKGVKAVNYNGLIGALVEAIKKQQQMISQLQQKNNQQEQTIALQGKTLTQLKQENEQRFQQMTKLMQKTQEQTVILTQQIKILRTPQTQTVAWVE